MDRRSFLKGLGAAVGGLLLPAQLVAGQCSDCGQNGLLVLPGGEGWACPKCGHEQRRRAYSFGKDDGWHQIVCSYDGAQSGEVQMYIDGDRVEDGKIIDDGYIHTPTGFKVSKTDGTVVRDGKVMEPGRYTTITEPKGTTVITRPGGFSMKLSEKGEHVEFGRIPSAPNEPFSMAVWAKMPLKHG